MGKGLFDALLDSFFDSTRVGKLGEIFTEGELNLVRFFGRDGKVLRNVYVPKDGGETTEIDVLFITQKGIFVIESKNYSGWVFGDEKSTYWTVTLPSGFKNRLYNPIKQNRSHIKWLGRFLNDSTPMFSVVAFSERCELKKVSVESSDVKVIKRDRLYATIRSIWESVPDVLSQERVDELCAKLKELTDVSADAKLEHINAINENHRAPSSTKAEQPIAVAPNPSETAQADKLCPRCGAPLVLRTAKKGANAGNSFYGCSGYPKCRYIENVEAR